MKRFKRITILMTIVFVLLLVLFYVNFNISFSRQSEEEATRNLDMISEQEEIKIQQTLENALIFVKGAACQFADYGDNLHSAEAMARLKKIKEESNFSRMCLTSTDGKATFTGGYKTELSKREYVEQAMDGECGISSLITSVVSKKKCFVIFAPVYKQDEVIGMVHGTIETDYLASLLNDKNKNVRLNTLVYNEYGQFLFSDSHAPTGEINEIVNQQTSTGVDKLLSYCIDGKEYMGFYQRITFNGWHMLVSLPKSSLMDFKTGVERSAIYLVIEIIVAFFIFYAIKVFEAVKRRKRLSQTVAQVEFVNNNMPGGMLKCTIDHHYKIVYISEGIVRMFGYSPKEIKEEFDNNYINMVYPEDRNRIMQVIDDNKHKKSGVVKYRVENSQGELLWIEEKYRIVNEGQQSYFYCLLLDITDRVRDEEEIKVNNELTDILLNQTGKQLFEYDLIHKTVKFASGRELTNIPNSLIADGIVSKEDEEKLYRIYRSVIEGGKNASGELRIFYNQSGYLWSRVTIANLYNENELIRTVGILEDITEQKKMEQDYQRQIQKSYDEVYQLDYLTNNVTKILCEGEIPEDKDKYMQLQDCLNNWNQTWFTERGFHTVGDILKESSLEDEFASGNDEISFNCSRQVSTGHFVWYSIWVNKLIWEKNGSHSVMLYAKNIDQLHEHQENNNRLLMDLVKERENENLEKVRLMYEFSLYLSGLIADDKSDTDEIKRVTDLVIELVKEANEQGTSNKEIFTLEEMKQKLSENNKLSVSIKGDNEFNCVGDIAHLYQVITCLTSFCYLRTGEKMKVELILNDKTPDHQRVLSVNVVSPVGKDQQGSRLYRMLADEFAKLLGSEINIVIHKNELTNKLELIVG